MNRTGNLVGRRSYAVPFFLLMALSVTFSAYGQNQSSGNATPSQPANQSLQTTILDTLMTAFDHGDSSTKLGVIQHAKDQPADQMKPLYSHALDFLVNNAPQFMNDGDLYQMALDTVRSIANAGTSAELSQLWNLYESVTDDTLRIEILNDIGTLDNGDTQTVANLNGWIEQEAISSQGGSRPDKQVMQAAVDTLVKIADASSFSTFLHVVLAQFSDSITSSAEKGMFSIKGDPVALAVSAIGRLNVSQWSIASSFFLTAKDATEAVRAGIAAGVLSLAVNNRTPDGQQQASLRNVRADLVRYLTKHPEKSATDALIQNFSLTVQEFNNGTTTRDRLLESIASLGATGSEAAARRLSDFMNLLNTYTENDRSYDTQVVLAVINNLKSLGYQLSYQPLYYATLLKYSQRVTQAANDALSALQK